MQNKWLIDIQVDIVPKERARKGKKKPYITKQGKVSTVKFYTPKSTAECQAYLRWQYRFFMRGKKIIPKGVPVKVSFVAFVTSKFQGGCGDMDNRYKLIADAGNKILWYDDFQICKWGESEIKYSTKTPRLVLIVEWGDI